MAGLERCIARLVNHLDDSRFSPIIVCLDRNGDAAAWLTRDDVPIVELHKRAGNDLPAIRRLAGALRRYEVDVVHSHNWGTLLETVLARRWARVPVHVHAEHGLAFGDQAISAWRRRLRRQVARWALRRVDAVVAVAEQVRQRLTARFGYPAENVRVIGNGVDPPSNGQHYPAWAVWGFYTEPVNPRMVVHNEEHGGVVLWWGSKVPTSTVDQLHNFYDEQSDGSFGTPYPKLGSKVAISAWTGNPAQYGRGGYYGQGHLAICPGYDAATKKAFEAFRKAYRGHGPEGIPLSYDMPGMGPQ